MGEQKRNLTMGNYRDFGDLADDVCQRVADRSGAECAAEFFSGYSVCDDPDDYVVDVSYSPDILADFRKTRRYGI